MESIRELPLIDVSALVNSSADLDSQKACAIEIDKACRLHGFFRIKGHGIPKELQEKLDKLSRQFFDMPEEVKKQFAMAKAGSAWRGWFPVGGELTSGKPDRKEGLYCGQELADDHPKVLAKVPLHGKNLFPDTPAELGPTILEWFQAMSNLGKQLLRGVALGLGMPAYWFATTICQDPTELFRVFHYPPPDLSHLQPGEHPGWGVGEHTDYGILTILAQDSCGGLQVRMPGTVDEWIHVPAEEGVFVVNIGDMLDKLTEGRYRSTPHRVLNVSGKQRLSFPFFVDPSWDAEVTPLPLSGSPPADDAERRWDSSSVHAWAGKYGEYLSGKVSKCFPELFQGVTSTSE